MSALLEICYNKNTQQCLVLPFINDCSMRSI